MEFHGQEHCPRSVDGGYSDSNLSCGTPGYDERCKVEIRLYQSQRNQVPMGCGRHFGHWLLLLREFQYRRIECVMGFCPGVHHVRHGPNRCSDHPELVEVLLPLLY